MYHSAKYRQKFKFEIPIYFDIDGVFGDGDYLYFEQVGDKR